MGSAESKEVPATHATENENEYKNANEKFVCKVCKNIFDDPVDLECGHTFCRVCKDIHWELEPNDTRYTCPYPGCEKKWNWRPAVKKNEAIEKLSNAEKNIMSKEKAENEKQEAANGGSNGCGEQPNYRQVRKNVIETFSEWKSQRIEIMRYLLSNIIQLRERSKNVNIAKIAGASAGVAGGAMCIAGIALAPVTFGASLGLTIAGISVGVAGGTTSAGSVIVKSVMDKTTNEGVTAALEADQILTKELLSNMQCLFKAAGGGNLESIGITVVKSAAQISLSVLNIADDVAIGVVRGTAAAGLRVAGIALSGVFMVIDLASIVQTGIDLSKGSPSGLADQLQITFDGLKLILIKMVKLENQL